MVQRPSLITLAPVLFVALWSTGFVGAKFGLPYAEPMTFLTIRFAIAAAALAAFAAIKGELSGDRLDWRGAAIVGVLIHGVYLGGVFTAIWLGTGAALASLIVGLQPVATAFMAGGALGERLTRRQWVGMALGFGGVAIAVQRKLGLGEVDALGILLCLGGLLGISWATILQKRRGVSGRLAADSAIQFGAAAAFTAVFALLLETGTIRWHAEFFLALTWMVIALSLGAISLLYALLRRGAASRTASLFFLVPGVTALMAWAMFGETYGALELIGLLTATAGVWLVVQAPRASR